MNGQKYDIPVVRDDKGLMKQWAKFLRKPGQSYGKPENLLLTLQKRSLNDISGRLK